MKILKNVILSGYTTLKIGGPAKEFIEVYGEIELVEAVAGAKKKGIDYFILAGGSNLLVSDSGFRGLVIHNCVRGLNVEEDKIRVKSGEIFQKLVDSAIDHGLSGIESTTGIQGTVGGAIYGNAGAYGQTISDILTRVKVFDGNETFWMDKDACQFSYRESIFKKEKRVILEAEFRHKRGNVNDLRKKADEILELRKRRYPDGLKSPGSFFKNVVLDGLPKDLLKKIPAEKVIFGKIPAGYLLEVVGAKGARIGDVQIAPYHGNLFLNLAEGKASDFLKLATIYRDKVSERFGINLEPEVQVVGL